MSDADWSFLKSYPPGVRFDMPLPEGPVQEILARTARNFPDHVAVEFNGATLTYGALQALVLRAATGFRALGVGPGVHVGLYLPNCPHYLIAFFGVLTAGGVIVNYSPLDAARVLEHKVEDSETDILVTLDLAVLYPQMGALLGRSRLRRLVVGNLGDFSPEPETVAGFLKAAGMTVDLPADEQHLSFRRLLDNDGSITPAVVADPAATLAVLQYTGGTTGLPKGAMLSHGNLTAAQAQLLELCSGDEPLFEIGAERILAVLPLFHIYALSVNMLLGITIAARLVLQPKFEVEQALATLTAARITFFPGVPTMYAGLINHPAMAKADLTALKFCGTGGAPLPVELADQFQRLTGCRLTEGWGMTETTATGTFTPAKGPLKPGSCGVPVPHVRLKFIDVADPAREVGRGERGELCIAGPNVMAGYWKKPSANAEAFTADGYFRTGDVAWMDEDGYVHIVDRTKDMILCGGFNVYPRVIEEAIYEHPAIAEVTVIGIADTYRGQAPKAFVTLKPGAAPVSLEDMQGFLKSRLGKHEQIAALEIRSELPKTPVGKLSKKELVEEEARKHAEGMPP